MLSHGLLREVNVKFLALGDPLALFGEFGLDKSQELVLIFLYGGRLSRRPAAIPELILSRRHLFGDCEQDMIRQHVVTRLVIESRHEVSPLEQHLQDSQLVERVRVPASLHYREVVVVLDHGLLVDLEGQCVTFVAS